MYFLRATRPSTILSICECISGSPPGMETIGVPHSSTALKHSSGVNSFFRMWGGYWIFPHPVHALFQDVGGDGPHLRNWYWHCCAYTLGSVVNSFFATTGNRYVLAQDCSFLLYLRYRYFCLRGFVAITIIRH